MDEYRLTPMLRQYVAAKKAYPHAVLMFRMGDFFELFFDDAKLAARELDITLTSRDKTARPIPMAGVPHHAVEGYIAKLVARGHTVAICDQIEDAKLAQGLVRRDITRIISPGTVSDLSALEPSRASYLACVVADLSQGDVHGPTTCAVAFLDLLAGEVLTTWGGLKDIVDELHRLSAREVLADGELLQPLRQALASGNACVRAMPAPQDCAAPRAVPGSPSNRLGLLMAQAAQGAQAYAASTQRQTLPHLSTPRCYAVANHLVMDEATRKSLELVATQADGKTQGSLFAHLNRTRTSVGARLLRSWLLLPETNLGHIAQRADVVGAWQRHRPLREGVQQALAPIRDLERLAGRVALGRANPRDLQALALSLQALPSVAHAVAQGGAQDEGLSAMAQSWQGANLLPELTARLIQALVDEPPVSCVEGGIFARGHDAELDRLIVLSTDSQAFIGAFEGKQRQETGIASLKVRYNRVFGYYIEVGRHLAPQMPEHYIRRQTLANAERFVTPELKTFETQVLEAEGKRRELEQRLFTDLLADVAQALSAIKILVRLVAQADALASLAEVADKHRYVRPFMVESATIDVQAARHPVIEVLLPLGEPFVPNDVALNADDRALMLVTGPNMAGKSTLMRQVALCAIMAQMGGFVPAARATLGVCDRLYTRVGAQDNLAQGQSTFMVEMMETANILRHATRQSLVLLDEIGRGTSTFDGLSIAWAVAEHLHDINGCRTLFATHYHELTALTQSHPRAVAMQVTAEEIDGEVVFLRQLQEGGASRSYGIEVARLARMPESVLNRARQVLRGLEEGHSPAHDQVAVAELEAVHDASAAASKQQLGLFISQATPAPSGSRHASSHPSGLEVLGQLAAAQVDNLTPMQALKLIHTWQQRLRKVESAVAAAGAQATVRRGQRRGRA